MKPRIKRKIIWLDEWNIRELEAWFSDMASQGWTLTKLGSVFATFEESSAQEVAFRCDVFNVDEESDADQRRIELYRKSGWEFVDSRRYIQIFRGNENGQTSEVYATPVEQAETLSMLQKKIKATALLTLILSVFMVIINYFSLQIDPVQNYLEDGFIIPVYTIVTYTFIVIRMITGMIHMAKLIKRLKSGDLNEDYIDYTRKVNVKKFVSMCGIVFVVILTVFTFNDLTKVGAKDLYPEIPQGDLPVVQMSDIMNRIEYEQAITPVSNGQYDNYYRVGSSIFVPKQYELHQSVQVSQGEGSGSYSLTIMSYSYKVRNESLARKFTQALKEKHLNYGSDYELISNGKFDELWMGKDHLSLELLARNGNEVYYFFYNGTDISDEKVEKILSKIEENF